MGNETVCSATIFCDKKYFDDVWRALNDLNISIEDGSWSAGDDCVNFVVYDVDSEDAKDIIKELGGKTADYNFYFESYDYGDKWRYTKEFGEEGEETYYKSDAVCHLRELGYTPAEIEKILGAF